jgi:predicted membrane-bound mannosyltransferase
MSKDKKAILWARRNLLKTIAIAMAIVVAFSTGYLARETVLTQTPSTITISPQNFVEEVSYTIFIDDDGYTKARNGKTAQIDFQDKDAATVIQSAINALTDGGVIHIKKGVII